MNATESNQLNEFLTNILEHPETGIQILGGTVFFAWVNETINNIFKNIFNDPWSIIRNPIAISQLWGCSVFFRTYRKYLLDSKNETSELNVQNISIEKYIIDTGFEIGFNDLKGVISFFKKIATFIFNSVGYLRECRSRESRIMLNRLGIVMAN